MLLPYLNAASTFNLAQAFFSSKKDSVVLGVLQRSLVWNRLIERSLPFFLSPVFSIASYFPSMLEIKMNTVVFLAAILKMFKDPVPLEMDLLFFICKRFPPFVDQEQVDLSHHLPPHHFWTHSVSPEGFVLLKKVESALGITKQKIEFIVTVIDSERSFLNSLWYLFLPAVCLEQNWKQRLSDKAFSQYWDRLAN